MWQPQGFDPGAHGFRQLPAVLRVGFAEQQHELLAAVARSHVGRALGVRIHLRCHLLKAAVPGLVPEAVVVGLEVIHIQHQQRQRQPAAPGAQPFPVEERVELATVRDVRQRVDTRHPPQFLLGLLAQADVVQQAEEPRALQEDRRHGQIDADRAAVMAAQGNLPRAML